MSRTLPHRIFLVSIFSVALSPFLFLNLDYSSAEFQYQIPAEVLEEWGDAKQMTPAQKYRERTLYPLLSWVLLYGYLFVVGFKATPIKLSSPTLQIIAATSSFLIPMTILAAKAWTSQCQGFGCLGTGLFERLILFCLCVISALSSTLYLNSNPEWSLKKKKRLFLFTLIFTGIFLMNWLPM